MEAPFEAEIVAVNAKLLVEAEPITTLEVHVITLLAALQVQSAACAPLRATGPLGTLSCVGSTSTTVIKPLVGTAPTLETVNAYVVGPDVSKTSSPLVLLKRRSG